MATLVASYGPSLVNFRRPLIEEFRRRGYEVVAAAPEIDDGTRHTLRSIGAEVVDLDLVRRSLVAVGDLGAIRSLRRLVRRRAAGDVVVPYTIKPILLTGVAHRLTRRPARLVVMFTGLGVLSRTEGSVVGRLLRWAIRWALRSCEGAIVQHGADESWLRRHGIVPLSVPIHIVPGSGVDTDHFAFEPLADNEVPEVLYLGRMVPEKGIAAFCDLAVAADFPSRWVAVGPFEDDDTRGLLLRRFAEAGVEYRGATFDVRPHLAASRVVTLLTTYGEGIPRVIQEAMAVGRPVVVSDAPGCQAAVEDGTEGSVVDPGDIAGTLMQVRRLCEDVGEAARMGRAGRETAVRVFEARGVAAKTCDAVGTAR